MHTPEKRSIGVNTYDQMRELREQIKNSSDKKIYTKLYKRSVKSPKKLKSDWCVNVVFVHNEVVEI